MLTRRMPLIAADGLTALKVPYQSTNTPLGIDSIERDSDRLEILLAMFANDNTVTSQIYSKRYLASCRMPHQLCRVDWMARSGSHLLFESNESKPLSPRCLFWYETRYHNFSSQDTTLRFRRVLQKSARSMEHTGYNADSPTRLRFTTHSFVRRT